MQMSSSAFASAVLDGSRCCSSTRPAVSIRQSCRLYDSPVVSISHGQHSNKNCRSLKVQAQRTVLSLDRSKKAEHSGRALDQGLMESDKQAALLATAPMPYQELNQLYLAWNLSVQLSTPPPRSPKASGPGGKDDEFYANVGNAIRTLREEIPQLFQHDFTCEFSSTLKNNS